MSWFDSAQLANFASKAIHEAQKKLDKALDIEGEEKSNKGKSSVLYLLKLSNHFPCFAYKTWYISERKRRFQNFE